MSGTKNKLTDLADHCFMALERLDALGDATDIDPEALAREIQRAQAVGTVAAKVIDIGRLALDAAKVKHDLGPGVRAPALLGLDKD
jgi:hypothetical protein